MLASRFPIFVLICLAQVLDGCIVVGVVVVVAIIMIVVCVSARTASRLAKRVLGVNSWTVIVAPCASGDKGSRRFHSQMQHSQMQHHQKHCLHLLLVATRPPISALVRAFRPN